MHDCNSTELIEFIAYFVFIFPFFLFFLFLLLLMLYFCVHFCCFSAVFVVRRHFEKFMRLFAFSACIVPDIISLSLSFLKSVACLMRISFLLNQPPTKFPSPPPPALLSYVPFSLSKQHLQFRHEIKVNQSL